MAQTLKSKSKYGRTRRQRKKQRRMRGGFNITESLTGLINKFKPATQEEACEEAKNKATEICNASAKPDQSAPPAEPQPDQLDQSVIPSAQPDQLDQSVIPSAQPDQLDQSVIPSAQPDQLDQSVPSAQPDQLDQSVIPSGQPVVIPEDVDYGDVGYGDVDDGNVGYGEYSEVKQPRYNGGAKKSKRKNKKQSRHRKKLKSRKHKKISKK
jgi:hypothetical protein